MFIIRRGLGSRIKTLSTSVAFRVLDYLTWNVSTKMIRRSHLHLYVSLWNTPETEALLICKGTKVSSYWAGLLSEITVEIPVIPNVYFSVFRVASFMFLLLEVQLSVSLNVFVATYAAPQQDGRRVRHVGSTVNRRKRTKTNKKKRKNRVACKYTANTTAYRFEKTHVQ